MSAIPTLRALLIVELKDQLKDLFHAENQLLEVLPKMAEAATDPDLKAGFTTHLEETRSQVTRLTEALEILGLPPKMNPCHAMLGLVEEGTEAIEMNGPAAIRDAALIGAAQCVEHYEMASYGTARAIAELLGEKQIVKLVEETLKEEAAANKKLTELSATVNKDALAESAETAEVSIANR